MPIHGNTHYSFVKQCLTFKFNLRWYIPTTAFTDWLVVMLLLFVLLSAPLILISCFTHLWSTLTNGWKERSRKRIKKHQARNRQVKKFFSMPHTAKSHAEWMRLICGRCCRKQKDLRPINPSVLSLLQNHHFQNYSLLWMPTVICKPCLNTLRHSFYILEWKGWTMEII